MLPLLACDEAPATVTMRTVEMREVGGVIMLTGQLEVTEVAMQTTDGAALDVSRQPLLRSGKFDEQRPTPPPPSNHAECRSCTCDLVTWTCECSGCEAQAEPLL